MPLFSSSPVDDIKARLDIVDIISEYVRLTKAGGNFKALCPFHHEKSPSFMVSQEKQIWHCFGGCDEGGDMFSFVMKMEGMEFPEALKILAQKANIEIRHIPKKIQDKRLRLYEVNEAAAGFFHETLMGEQGTAATQAKIARAYLKNRKISPQTINYFSIGLAHDSFSALLQFLSTKKFTTDEMVTAGLIARGTNNRTYDRFRGRLMFPLKDQHDQIVGFTGRILDDAQKNVGKYVNTPETPIYHKGNLLYGLEKAKTDIRRLGNAIIVEGQMDVITSHQAGIKNTVASSGTALTDYQLALLKRFTSNIFFAFDTDAAGQEATKRGIELAIRNGFNVKIIQTPEGKDPDECIREHPQLWLTAIKQAKLFMDFYFDSALAQKDLTNIIQKKKAAAELLAVIAKFPNKIEQAHYIQKLSEKINVAESILLDALNEQKSRARQSRQSRPFGQKSPSAAQSTQARAQSPIVLVEEELFGLVLKFPHHLPLLLLDLDETHFYSDEIKRLYLLLKQQYTKDGDAFDTEVFQKKLKKNHKELADKIDLLVLRVEVIEDRDEDTAKGEIQSHIKRIRMYQVRTLLHKLQQSMKEAEAHGDEKRLKQLGADFSLLSKKLSHLMK